MTHEQFNFSELEKPKLNTRLIYITQAAYHQNWHSTLHTHHFTELFYVTKGKGSFIMEDEIFDVVEDDLIIVNPGTNHTEVSKGDVPLEYIVLGAEGLSFSLDKENLENHYNLYNYKTYKDSVLLYLQTILDEAKKKKENYDIVCHNLLEILIVNIIRHTNYTVSIDTDKKTSKQCSFIKKYIQANFKEDITLDTLAKVTHLNKFYLSHAFKKYTGLSPINYLIHVRILESKNLLENTNYFIAEISNIIGFSSQSYFSQVF